MTARRGAGVLAHITSLPSKYGIGDLGRTCTSNFINFLRSLDHSLWSILPLNPPDETNCPYNARSTFAGNHMIICPDEIPFAEDISRHYPGEQDPPCKVNFDRVNAFKEKILYESFKKSKGKLGTEYDEFIKHEEWLENYAIFMAAAQIHGYNYDWSTWEPVGLRRCEPKALSGFKEKYADLIEFHSFVQYVFFTQLNNFKKKDRLM